jgi:para-nitrobenzyl esterase
LAWSALDTERVFACTQLATTNALAQQQPLFAYEFADPDAPPFSSVAFPSDIPNVASHGSELAYLFDVDDHPPVPLTDAQTELGARLIENWTSFAHGGQPATDDAPTWQAWDPQAANPYVQAFSPGPDGIASVDDVSEHHCDFWASFLTPSQ